MWLFENGIERPFTLDFRKSFSASLPQDFPFANSEEALDAGEVGIVAKYAGKSTESQAKWILLPPNSLFTCSLQRQILGR